MTLNESALALCADLVNNASRFHVSAVSSEAGTRVIDCGVLTRGGLEAGRRLAQICLAGLGQVEISAGSRNLIGPSVSAPMVTVRTDHPILACMASQYAGWQIAGQKFFAMGSGPMRAVRGREKLFAEFECQEKSNHVVGVLESSKLPPAEVCQHVASECGVEAENVVLLVARTASIAGSVQVVARSIETALHKMHELGFDLRRVVSGFGAAPLPAIAADDMIAIGRTNDAVLYGGDVSLWVTGDDASLEQIGPQIPSSSSRDYGAPFADIFARYNRDFYKIDPLLFSPAKITLINLDTGRSWTFGQFAPDVLARSFDTSVADI